MKKTVIFILLVSVFINCKKVDYKKVINPKLYEEIELYIIKTENEKAKNSIESETDIYVVYMEKLDEGVNIDILQNIFVSRKDLDGYITIGDNNVFFYNSIDSLVDKNKLKNEDLNKFPDDNSDLIIDSFNPLMLRLKYKNGSLSKR